MRPHALTLTAFGPFAETVLVDFDELAAGGLFLLHGDTGAGKTSILDGVAFALYGRVPGQRGQAARLRSDHAEAGTRTAVELDVTVGRRRLRIRRQPEQERPKKRGSGTTRDQASVLLQEMLDGGWVTLSTRVGEADAELLGLLGMSAEQFHQVVLLPQGEFARFLRSDATERAGLLQRLFATDRFRKVEDWLAHRRRQVAAELEEALAVAARLAARVAQVAGVDEPAEPGPRWAERLAAQAAVSADLAESASKAATGARIAAQERLADARELARRQTKRQAALTRLAQLAAGEPEVEAMSVALEAGRRADTVRAGLAEAAQRQRAAQAAVTMEQVARTEAAALGLDAVPPGRLAAVLAERREAMGRLAEATRLELELREQEAAAAAAERELSAARTRATELVTALQGLPERRARATAALEGARRGQVAAPERRAEAERFSRAVLEARARDDLDARRAELAASLLAARERAVDLTEEAQRLRNGRIDSMIAELSASLVDGDPCPVCGASEHPDPSEVRGVRVTREQEDQARSAADEAQQAVAGLRAEVAGLEAEFGGCVRRLAATGLADAPVGGLETACAEASADAERLEEAAGRIEGAEREMEVLVVQEHELRERLADAERTADLHGERNQEASGRAGQLRARLAVLLAGAPDVAAARCREQGAIGVGERLLEVCRAAGIAAAEATRAWEQLEREVTAAGFGSPEEAAGALRDPADIRALEANLQRARSERAAATAAMADPDVDVPLEPPAPVRQAQLELSGAEATAAHAAAQAARARSRAVELAALAPKVTAQLGVLTPLAAWARDVRALADLMAGQGGNRLRMTLSAFVLAARLEEVAAVASERLRQMTQGRYTLVHTDGGRGGGRSGLGLLARDAWTGQDRETSTLSGGETFLASLALALALGDVVAAEAGGATVETLFIDEGFGSLDEDTLDEVMDTLDGLREGGRLVGLVSHVAELRQRIPSQVRVHKGRRGSSVTMRPG